MRPGPLRVAGDDVEVVQRDLTQEDGLEPSPSEVWVRRVDGSHVEAVQQADHELGAPQCRQRLAEAVGDGSAKCHVYRLATGGHGVPPCAARSEDADVSQL